MPRARHHSRKARSQHPRRSYFTQPLRVIRLHAQVLGDDERRRACHCVEACESLLKPRAGGGVSRVWDKKYSLTFDTEGYFGGRGVETFFPEVVVQFVVRQGQKGEHFHVPVLLGPFGYTTYRGS